MTGPAPSGSTRRSPCASPGTRGRAFISAGWLSPAPIPDGRRTTSLRRSPSSPNPRTRAASWKRAGAGRRRKPGRSGPSRPARDLGGAAGPGASSPTPHRAIRWTAVIVPAEERGRVDAPGAVTLTRKGAARWRDGHPWIFRDDVVPADLSNGAIVTVLGPGGDTLGTAFYGSVSKIALRRLAGPQEIFDEALVRARL